MQRFLKRARDRLGAAVARGLAAAGSALPGAPQVEGLHPGLHVARVLGGPLRGRLLALPTLQRPSYLLGAFEPHVVAAMRAHVRPGAVAYDVGANVGYHTLALARLVGETGAVIAVEPSPADRRALASTLQLNHIANVRVIDAALAEESGTVHFATFGYSGIGRIAREREPADALIQTVPATTLDQLVFSEGYPAPAFMKVDVEGAELRVLLGGMRALATHRPVIVCEVRWHDTYESITSLLATQGYEAHILWRGELIGDVLYTPT